MSDGHLLLSCAAFFAIALLYSSVGHAGASGYLAVMGLLAYPVYAIKPVSLVLNCVVAVVTSSAFIRAGHFERKLFWPFAATSMPAAFVGGALRPEPWAFQMMAGAFLLASAGLMLARKWLKPLDQAGTLRLPVALTVGALVGLLSGILGVGGGIFLTPILVMAGWCSVKTAAGVSALFILVNSLMGLAGHFSALRTLPSETPLLAVVVLVGGMVGSQLGAHRFDSRVVRGILSAVLLTAGIKFLTVH